MLDKNMQILDIIYKYPATQDVFKEYDQLTGSCVMCEYLFATLEELANICNINVETLIQQVERAM